MPFRLLGVVLLAAGAMAILSVLPRAFGYLSARVSHPDSAYSIASASPLVRCAQPRAITLRRNGGLTGDWFQCTNHYNAAVDLTWSIVDDGGSGIAVSGSSGTMLAGTVDSCRTVTLTAGNNAGTFNLVYRAATPATAGFYAQVEFTGTVTVHNGNSGLGGACP